MCKQTSGNYPASFRCLIILVVLVPLSCWLFDTAKGFWLAHRERAVLTEMGRTVAAISQEYALGDYYSQHRAEFKGWELTDNGWNLTEWSDNKGPRVILMYKRARYSDQIYAVFSDFSITPVEEEELPLR